MDLRDTIVTNVLYPIIQAFDSSLNTDTVTIEIRRLSDSYTWNFTTLKFEAANNSGNMIFFSGITWQQSFTPPINDVYIITIYNSTRNIKNTQTITSVGGTVGVQGVALSQSKISVWNLALGKVGADFVSAEGEDSSSARACENCWDFILEEVLGEAPWTFAQKRAALALLVGQPVFIDDNMLYVYAKPSDLIKVNFINNASATYKVEGDQILSEIQNLKIIYTARVSDPSKWFSLFTAALATRLAAEIAMKLSESKNAKKDLLKEYEEIRLPRAISADSQQGSPLQPIQDEWETARFIDSGALIAQPGSQTWHPVY